MNDDEFEEGMKVLLATWPKEAPPPQTLVLYAAALGRLDADIWGGALIRCVSECTFFPRPAEVLTKATEFVMERDSLSEHWAREKVMGGRRDFAVLISPPPKPEPSELPALNDKRQVSAPVMQAVTNQLTVSRGGRDSAGAQRVAPPAEKRGGTR